MADYYIFIRRIFITGCYACSIIFVMNHNRTYGELLKCKAGLSPQLFITGPSKAMLLLCFILIVNVRPLSVCL